MTVSNAPAILEEAISKCKHGESTPKVREALDFLQPRIRPEWLIPHFRYHAELNEKNEVDLGKEAQQDALRQFSPAFVNH
jgi:hypothetical protein